MNKIIYYLFFLIGLMPSLFTDNSFLNSDQKTLETPQIERKAQSQAKENLYFSDMAQDQDSDLVSWHTSHRSHRSHASHRSHYSHRSGR